MRALLAISLLAVSFAGCASRGSDEPPPAAPSTPTAATPDERSAAPTALPPTPPITLPTIEPPAFPEGPYDLRATIRNGAFDEARLEAARLVTITWTNADTATHSVVSNDGQFAGSGPIPPGGEFSRTFLTAGEFPFSCRYHGNMQGILIVH